MTHADPLPVTNASCLGLIILLKISDCLCLFWILGIATKQCGIFFFFITLMDSVHNQQLIFLPFFSAFPITRCNISPPSEIILLYDLVKSVFFKQERFWMSGNLSQNQICSFQKKRKEIPDIVLWISIQKKQKTMSLNHILCQCSLEEEVAFDI